MNTSDIVGILIAALGGAAVGLERQWSGHADGPGARFAGIRTFTLLGAAGGLSGWLWTAGITLLSAILLVGAVGANARLFPRVLVAIAILNPAAVVPLVCSEGEKRRDARFPVLIIWYRLPLFKTVCFV